MLAEWFAILVEELGIGSFQDPVELCDAFLAGVDLIAFGVHGQEELFAGWRLQLRRDVLSQHRKNEQECEGELCADLPAHRWVLLWQ